MQEERLHNTYFMFGILVGLCMVTRLNSCSDVFYQSVGLVSFEMVCRTRVKKLTAFCQHQHADFSLTVPLVEFPPLTAVGIIMKMMSGLEIRLKEGDIL